MLDLLVIGETRVECLAYSGESLEGIVVGVTYTSDDPINTVNDLFEVEFKLMDDDGEQWKVIGWNMESISLAV